jgi:hypothetical protein
MARYSMNLRSRRAWNDFRERVAGQGGRVLEVEWLGAVKPHRCLCAAGHECQPRPNDTQRGKGLCPICAGHDSATAWAEFQERVARQGGRVLEMEWLGARTPHRCLCAAGHECQPRPNDVQQGRGICGACAGHDPATAWAEFQERIGRAGGTLLESSWLGSGIPHQCLCAVGHVCKPQPNFVQQGGGICGACAGKDPKLQFAAFQVQVARLGGSVLELEWLGSGVPHRCLCASRHECTPIPGNVQSGQGICRICKGKIWGVFYVLTNQGCHQVKPGITSNDERQRFRRHRRNGFITDDPSRLFTNFLAAHEVEVDVRKTLKLAGVRPKKGLEYYDMSSYAEILDVVDNHPAVVSHLLAHPEQRAGTGAARAYRAATRRV